MNIESIQSNYICPICISPINHCCVTKCGHCFCQQCLKESLDFNSKCPYCNFQLKSDEFYRCYLFDSLIESLNQLQQSQSQNQRSPYVSSFKYYRNNRF